MIKQLRPIRGTIRFYELINAEALLSGEAEAPQLGEMSEPGEARMAFCGNGEHLYLYFSINGSEGKHLVSLSSGTDEDGHLYNVRLYGEHDSFLIRGIYRTFTLEHPFAASFAEAVPEGY